MIQVDLTPYIGGTILSGRLFLKFTGAAWENPNFDDSVFRIYRCAKTDWTEFGCTWNSSGIENWSGGDKAELHQTVSGLASPFDLDFDNIGALIQDAITNRNGILSVIVSTDESEDETNYILFSSSENAGNEPLLEFTYELPKIAANALDFSQLAQNSTLYGKDPFAECLSSIPPEQFAVGIFENQIRHFLNDLASKHTGYRIHADDNSFAAVLALDQPRQYLTALERRVIKFLQHHADGCVISPRESDDACDPNEGD